MGVEGKDLGPKFFLGIDLGVLEGQISGGSFSDSIFDPSVIGASIQPPTTQVSKKLESCWPFFTSIGLSKNNFHPNLKSTEFLDLFGK